MLVASINMTNHALLYEFNGGRLTIQNNFASAINQKI